MNLVVLMGIMLNDPYYKAAEKEDDVSVAKFRLAVKKSWRRKGEEDYKFPITVFGVQADNLAKLCKKGTRLLIRGELSEGGYQDKNTKEWVYSWDVIANEWEFTESKKNSEKTQPEKEVQTKPANLEEAPAVQPTPMQEQPNSKAPVQNNYGNQSTIDDGVPEGFFTDFDDVDLPFN